MNLLQIVRLYGILASRYMAHKVHLPSSVIGRSSGPYSTPVVVSPQLVIAHKKASDAEIRKALMTPKTPADSSDHDHEYYDGPLGHDRYCGINE